MPISKLTGDIATAADPTLARFLKKINEVVEACNDDFDRIRQAENKIADINKELRELKVRLNNYG